MNLILAIVAQFVLDFAALAHCIEETFQDLARDRMTVTRRLAEVFDLYLCAALHCSGSPSKAIAVCVYVNQTTNGKHTGL